MYFGVSHLKKTKISRGRIGFQIMSVKKHGELRVIKETRGDQRRPIWPDYHGIECGPDVLVIFHALQPRGRYFPALSMPKIKIKAAKVTNKAETTACEEPNWTNHDGPWRTKLDNDQAKQRLPGQPRFVCQGECMRVIIVMLGGWQGGGTSEPAAAVFCSAWSLGKWAKNCCFSGFSASRWKSKAKYGYFALVPNLWPNNPWSAYPGSAVCDATEIVFAIWHDMTPLPNLSGWRDKGNRGAEALKHQEERRVQRPSRISFPCLQGPIQVEIWGNPPLCSKEEAKGESHSLGSNMPIFAWGLGIPKDS